MFVDFRNGTKQKYTQKKEYNHESYTQKDKQKPKKKNKTQKN